MNATVTTDEAAALLGVKASTVRGWVMRRDLEPVRRGAKPLRFRFDDVTRLHARRQPQSWHDTLDDQWERLLAAESQGVQR